MKRKNLWMSLILLPLVSCGEVSVDKTSSFDYSTFEAKAQTYSINDVLANMTVEGRSLATDDGLTFDYSGSALKFNLNCQGQVSINLTSEMTTTYDDSSEGKRGMTLFSVFVDGERTIKNLKADNETIELTIADNLPKGPHSFIFARQTNVYMSLVTIHSLTFNGTMIEKDVSSGYIEYIGDSYTSGYSLQGTKEGGGYDSSYDDPLDAYAYQSAKNLNSDYSLMAFSGAGFSYGYTPFTVPEVYPYLNYFRDDSFSYTPTVTPDLIVINLGTNDVSQVGFNNNHEQIEKGVKKLLDEVFALYKKTLPLIICTDATHENNDPVTTEAIETYYPDLDYKLVTLTTNDAKYNYHPSAECGNKQGQELAAAIKEYLPSVFNK